jgi:hypothetical protein
VARTLLPKSLAAAAKEKAMRSMVNADASMKMA